MGDHTTSDRLYTNVQLDSHVGGATPPQLQTEASYIDDQMQILDNQNIHLYPNIRYQVPKKQTQTQIRNQIQNQKYDSDTANTDVVKSSQQPLDVYLRRDSDRYNPYDDFQYKKGLMSDGYQLRRYKTTYVNIDSAFRNTNPAVFTEPVIKLPLNPLKFTNGSPIMNVMHPGHTFHTKDQITLTGAFSKIAVLRTYQDNGAPTFEIPKACNIMKIYYTHEIPLDYNSDSIQITLSGIRGDKGTGTQSTFLGSMPINLINSIQTVYLTVNDTQINCTTQYIIDLTGDPNYFVRSPDYFFVILPVNMTARGTTEPYVLSDYNFKLTFNSLAGIQLNEINAQYPINVNQLNGYQIIKNVYVDSYDIEVATAAIISTPTLNGGGGFVYVAKITSILQSYPNQNQYTISLDNVFHSVQSARLYSSEIPNTQQAIRSDQYKVNNKIYWNDIDDGDYLYSIAVPPGNYGTTDLIIVMQDLFLNTPRINAETSSIANAENVSYTPRHFMQIKMNESTNAVSFALFKEFILNNPIIQINPDITDQTVQVDPNATYQLTIAHPNHGMTKSGLTILIQGALSDKGIPSSTINGTHPVIQIINLDEYIITLPKFNLQADRTETGGGVNVFFYVPDLFRLRFDQPDTMGDVLGFRFAGQSTSITNFQSVVTNSDPYVFETGVNKNFIGQPQVITNNSLQLSGDNYIIMAIQELRTFTSIGPVKHAFAKILLCDSPGKILFNSFVPMQYTFEDPLENLFELTITFYSPDGTLFNFNGLDHSFTLEVVTIVDIPDGTGIHSNTGKNYNKPVKQTIT